MISATLPGLQGPKTYAPSPVWSGSTTLPVKFLKLSKAEANRLYYQAEALDAQTRPPGHQDGAIGRNGLAILRALLFRCLGRDTGRLDPSYDTIARLARISRSSVARGLKALRAAGVIHWQRRSRDRVEDGRFILEQDTNAYAVLPSSMWRGFRARPAAPPPEPGTWGDHPCGARDPLTEASQMTREGWANTTALAATLESDPDPRSLAAILGRLGRAIAAVSL
jgi:hypothetical protein